VESLQYRPLKCVPIRQVTSIQGTNYGYKSFYYPKLGLVLIRDVSLIRGIVSKYIA